jgi:hypothetical protein
MRRSSPDDDPSGPPSAQWVLGRGVVVAAGTGSNYSKVARNTEEDLGATALVLTADEMVRVGKAGERAAASSRAA